jgi:hypothetical protein
VGKVKSKVKGNGDIKKRIEHLMDDITDCIVKKDNDTKTEGDTEKAENTRKAGILRAAHSLLSCTKYLLETY